MEVFKKNKILGKIIISFVAIAILLSPIAPIIKNTNQKLAVGIEKREVKADKVKVGLNFNVKTKTEKIENSTTNSKVTFDLTMNSEDGTTSIKDYRFFRIALYTLKANETKPTADALPSRNGSSEKLPDSAPDGSTLLTYSFQYSATLPVNQKYYYLVVASDGTFNPATEGTYEKSIAFIDEDKLSYTDGYFTVGTAETQSNTTTISSTNQVKDYGLGCGITSLDGILGCISGVFYTVWEVSAWIARLAGGFLDFFVYFSTNSSSYSNAFVSKGWAAVRDIANIFFIIALLYISIKIILGMGGHDSKKIIVMVILMALLINFSLFFTKVIIDSTNILAKVFYNNIESKDSVTGGAAVGNEGEKSISVGLVSDYNPQKIIAFNEYENNRGRFIFITLILIGITLYTAYIFFTVALLFASRVAMLWISMIFAPIAFASYTLPFEIPGFGHKEWWKNLLENAFLAPIFVFLLYLIVMFAGMLSEIVKYQAPSGSSGENMIRAIMTVLVPFIILAILLMKAKEMAVKFAGEMGKTISGAAAALGGIALGGAALGGAALGRATFRSVAKNVQNDSARNKDLKTFGGYKDWSVGKKLNPFAYMKQAGKTTSAAFAHGIHSTPTWKKDSNGNRMKLGAVMKQADEGFKNKSSAVHTLDEKTQDVFHDKDRKFKDLTEAEQKQVKGEVDKDEMAKFEYGKKFKDIGAVEAGLIQAKFNADERPITNKDGKVVRVENLNRVNAAAGEKLKSESFSNMYKANAAAGEFVQALRKGSYDVRGLSKLETTSKSAKLPIGTIATIATGVRMGLKSGKIEHGTPQKDLFKDLGSTISEALKGVKINVSTGGGGGHDSHGGGGGHAKKAAHGGGGHH